MVLDTRSKIISRLLHLKLSQNMTKAKPNRKNRFLVSYESFVTVIKVTSLIKATPHDGKPHLITGGYMHKDRLGR